jgi:hypothetical protein
VMGEEVRLWKRICGWRRHVANFLSLIAILTCATRGQQQLWKQNDQFCVFAAMCCAHDLYTLCLCWA